MLAKLIGAIFKPSRRQLPVTATRTSGDGAAIARSGPLPADYAQRAEALVKAGTINAAFECYRSWAQAEPRAIEAYVGMGNTLVDLWSIEDAVAAYSSALALAPGSGKLLSTLLFHSHYLFPVNQERLFGLHRRYGEVMRKSRPSRGAGFALAPDPERRLRIGYVSPNLSRHSVGYFMEPVIEHHDRRHFEVYCYYTHELSDDATRRIRELADAWRDAAKVTDDALERMIRDDEIDILIDLAGHSKGNRLAVFARKAAPVQMTWLGYPDTTGLDTVDFRITDGTSDPSPSAELRHTERLLRLDDVFLCYKPPHDSPPVNMRPASEVVFASFNNISKVNRRLIEAWARILARVPGSRLILKSAALNYADAADRVLECCENCGIDPGRVELHGWIKDRHHHLQLYNNIDIALDTFPYNGTTTTCEALWMGVPVISLAGDVHMARVGATLLRSVGKPDLVAQSIDQYTDVAVALACDHARRASLRATLRDALRASPLLDHAGFTAKLERGFRESWAAWCARHHAQDTQR